MPRPPTTDCLGGVVGEPGRSGLDANVTGGTRWHLVQSVGRIRARKTHLLEAQSSPHVTFGPAMNNLTGE